MKIKQITSQNLRDFNAVYECEHCGSTKTGYGYDDSNFYRNVIPAMKCESCGKTAREIKQKMAEVAAQRGKTVEDSE